MEGAKQLADDPEIKLGVHMELNRIERALKNNWDTWPRLKQARALSVLHRGGWSTRKLADLVGCSATHVTDVMKLDDLDPYEKSMLAAGDSVRKVLKTRATRKKKAHASKLEADIDRGYALIKLWIETAGVPHYDEEAIIKDVLALERGDAIYCNIDGRHVYPAAVIGILLEKTKPATLGTGSGIDIMNDRIDWLQRFLRHAIPKWEIREQAVILALDKAGYIGKRPVVM
jgi:hypothetical protein